MKNQISLLFAAMLMLFSTEAFAQIKVGAGYVNSAHKMEVAGNSTTTNMNGAYVGVGYNISLGKVFGFMPSIQYEFLTTNDYNIFSLDGESVQEHYANIPLHFNAGLNLGEKTKLAIFAGPTLSYGIAASTNANLDELGKGGNVKKHNFYSDDYYNRFDVMLGGGINLEIAKKINISAGYNFGLVNRTSIDGATLKRNQLFIGVSYIF